MRHEPTKPDNIKYWIEDKPPWSVTIIAAVQQVALLGSIMTISVLLGRSVGLDDVGRANVLAVTMICAGIGVMLQALNNRAIGSGLFLPMHTSSAAFPAMTAAAQFGGLGLAFGMLSVVGVVQLLIGRFMMKLRRFFPVEIAGLAVFIIGVEVGLLGIQNIFGVGTTLENNPVHYLTGFSTLALIIAINTWMPSGLKPFAVIIGLVLGQAAAFTLGLVPEDSIDLISSANSFAIPSLTYFGWSVDWRFVPEFAIVGIALSFNCFAITVVAQRSVDASWHKADMRNIQRSLTAEGITNCIASLLNGATQTASGPAVGLAQTSGIASRIVSFAIGGLFILLSFFPIVAALWNSLLPAIVGAVLAFVGSFIILTGIKIVTLVLLDARRTITLGIAILGGFGAGRFSDAFDQDSLFQPIFSTPLTMTLTVAVLLHVLFQIKNRKRLTHEIELTENWPEQITKIVWELGESWGARPATVSRLEHVANEVVDVIASHDLIAGRNKVNLATSFDEYGCTLIVSYDGEKFDLVDNPPAPEELIEDPDAVRNLAGFLIKKMADTAAIVTRGQRVEVKLGFVD